MSENEFDANYTKFREALDFFENLATGEGFDLKLLIEEIREREKKVDAEWNVRSSRSRIIQALQPIYERKKAK